MRVHVVVLAVCALGAAVGCGGAAASTPPASEPSRQVAAAREIAPEPEEEPRVAPPPRGPGRLRVVNVVSGSESSGTVRVLDMGGQVVAEGRSGETFPVDAGTYRVVGEVTDASVLVDRPTRESDDPVEVVPGEEQVARVVHPVARVRLRVVQRGRPVTGWRAEVRRQTGGPALEIRASEEHTSISPGRYDAVLHVGGQRIEVSGIVFQGGATMDVPLNIE